MIYAKVEIMNKLYFWNYFRQVKNCFMLFCINDALHSLIRRIYFTISLFAAFILSVDIRLESIINVTHLNF